MRRAETSADRDFVRDLLRETARGFLGRHGPETRAEPGAWLDHRWHEIAQMGWTGVMIPEEFGGQGLGLPEHAILFEEFGRALYPGPFFATAALAQPALLGCADASERLASGSSVFTFAWQEPVAAVTLSELGGVACHAEERNGAWRLTGDKVGVPSLDRADEAVVVARSRDGIGLFLVQLGAAGTSVEPEQGLGDLRLDGTLRLDGATAAALAGTGDTPEIVSRVRLGGLIAASFEALGVAEATLAESVAYAAARHQFGRAIGSFQAISFPLACCYEDIQLARALAEWSVRAAALGDEGADLAASLAHAAAARAAVRTVEVAVQVAGGIGFTSEHGLQHSLSRALWLEAFESGTPRAHARLADALLAGRRPATVELMDDEAAARFRAEVREWIDDTLPTPERGPALISDPERYAQVKSRWQRAMADTGHLVNHWSQEQGGQGGTPLITAIFREEAIRAHPRVSHGDGGTDLVAPLLIEHGTPEQRARFLGGIRHETEIWAQGFSEPDAGSDLAALNMRASRDGDDWVLNGAKTWSTYAPVADWLFVLARTDPESTRHRGITCFIVDARAPGVEVRDIVDIAGEVEFGEVFFTDVRVAPENVLGEVGAGWAVAIMTLANERVIESCEDIGELGFLVDRLIDCLSQIRVGGGPATGDPFVREELAALWSRLEAVRLIQYRALVELDASDVPPPESEIVKLAWSEVGQDIARLGARLFASPAVAAEVPEIARFWRAAYLTSRSFTIYSGTSEILRSVIAERVLGLPRSR